MSKKKKQKIIQDARISEKKEMEYLNTQKGEDEQKKPQKKSESSQKDAQKWEEQFLRVNADFQNFKRRIQRERVEWMREAKIQVILSFLPLLDELYLALESSKKFELKGDVKSWIDGFGIMLKSFEKRLADLGVQEIDCSGSFDPRYHEAIVQVESEEHNSGDIVSVLTRGYALNDEIIRHAKVSVAK